MKNKKIKGFSLVELGITMLIIVILSAISMPIYIGNKENAIMAEGYALLGTLKSAQQAYYSMYGNFLMDNPYYVSISKSLGVNATGNKYFTDFSYCHNNGQFEGQPSLYFDASIRIPQAGGAFKYFYLQYNITLGQKFVWKDELDSSWGKL